MSNGAAAAAAAAMANAIKASGAIVKVENKDFMKIIANIDKPLIVTAGKSFWSPSHKYLTSYRGLAFFTKSSERLRLPGDCELIIAKKISIPDYFAS
jgi:hypothetical protein